MPELPDVQVFKEYLDATALHRPIETTRRHGKYLFAGAGDGWLRLHFGMTGGLEFREDRTEPDHTALALEFADGSRLAFLNQRRFGEIVGSTRSMATSSDVRSGRTRSDWAEGTSASCLRVVAARSRRRSPTSP